MAAFADPEIRAVLATIGGDDQITVLRHLDPEPVRADPKPFLGYSDNTNVLNWLWFHGIEGVHGGNTQVNLGPGPAPDAQHLASIRAALFGGDVELVPVTRTRDMGLPWDDPAALTEPPPDLPDMQPINPDGQPRVAEGTQGLANLDAAWAFRRNWWPGTGAIAVVVGDDRRPRVEYAKQRVSLSEAAGYFEFLMQQLADAQRAS